MLDMQRIKCGIKISYTSPMRAFNFSWIENRSALQNKAHRKNNSYKEKFIAKYIFLLFSISFDCSPYFLYCSLVFSIWKRKKPKTIRKMTQTITKQKKRNREFQGDCLGRWVREGDGLRGQGLG